MRLCLAPLLVALAAALASADEPPALDPVAVTRLRELYERKDYAAARTELLAAYAKTKDPQWLFALGQVELQLERYARAIEYYDQFIATHPPQEQIDLAQQAIGAARIQLAKQRPRRHRHWTLAETLLVVGGGAAVASGVGLFAYGRHVSLDQSGTLSDYADRVDRARTLQWSGVAASGLGIAAIAVAIVRWRLRPEDGPEVSLAGSAASVGWRW